MHNLLSRSSFKVFTVALVLLLVGSSGFPQKSGLPRIPQFVYGAWTIYRFIEVGGHAGQTKERAQAQISKTLEIRPQSFAPDKDLLWFDNACKNVNYKMKANADDLGDGSLGFYGLEEADKDQFVIVNCDRRDMYVLELAKNQKLAVYYDGWFFFLRKSKAISN